MDDEGTEDGISFIVLILLIVVIIAGAISSAGKSSGSSSSQPIIIQQAPSAPTYQQPVQQPHPATQTKVGKRYCPSCGRAIPADGIICPYCGINVGGQ